MNANNSLGQRGEGCGGVPGTCLNLHVKLMLEHAQDRSQVEDVRSPVKADIKLEGQKMLFDFDDRGPER